MIENGLFGRVKDTTPLGSCIGFSLSNRLAIIASVIIMQISSANWSAQVANAHLKSDYRLVGIAPMHRIAQISGVIKRRRGEKADSRDSLID